MLLNNNNSKLRILLIRILRKDPNLIPELIRNPLMIPRERIAEQDALTIHNVFKESSFSDKILNEFETRQLEDFAVELQELIGMHFTDEDLISIEIEEINRSMNQPARPLRFLPPNNYVIRNSSGYVFRITYFLKSRYIHRSNDIYVIISISNHCDEIITEQMEKPTILNHINNDITYHFVCGSCHRRFRLTPSLLDFC